MEVNEFIDSGPENKSDLDESVTEQLPQSDLEIEVGGVHLQLLSMVQVIGVSHSSREIGES